RPSAPPTRAAVSTRGRRICQTITSEPTSASPLTALPNVARMSAGGTYTLPLPTANTITARVASSEKGTSHRPLRFTLLRASGRALVPARRPDGVTHGSEECRVQDPRQRQHCLPESRTRAAQHVDRDGVQFHHVARLHGADPAPA